MKQGYAEAKGHLPLYIYLFDLCLLPTFHVMGLPFKVAYLLSFLWVGMFLVRTNFRLGGKYFLRSNAMVQLRHSKEGYLMIACIVSIILVTCLGEVTTVASTHIRDSSPFRDAIFFYVVLMGSICFGYAYYDFKKDYLIYLLAGFCLVNILLSAMGTSAPAVIRTLYRYTGEGEDKFTVRLGGTMGNPNATLCVMNILFMSVVLYIKTGEIDVTNKIKLITVVLLPLLLNCFINSRGEFLVTIILELVLAYYVGRGKKFSFSSIVKFLMVIAVIVIFSYFAFQYLAEKYPTVAFSLNRIMTIFTDTAEKDSDSFQDRPFIHWAQFIDRFASSPIWGTGFSKGTDYPFIRSCEQYHNDWFRIFGSGGVIGGGLWICMIIKAAKKCGIWCIVPFFVTAISNTFIASPPAIGLFFMMVMVQIRRQEDARQAQAAEITQASETAGTAFPKNSETAPIFLQ